MDEAALQQRYARALWIGLVCMMVCGAAMILPVFGVRWSFLPVLFYPAFIGCMVAIWMAGRAQKALRAQA